MKMNFKKVVLLGTSIFFLCGCGSEENVDVRDASTNSEVSEDDVYALTFSNSNCGTNHLQDIGNHELKNWQSDDFDGWSCMYWNGDINSFEVTWEAKDGETLPVVHKSVSAGSSGYPKRVDNATQNNMSAYVDSSYEFWADMNGLWGHHLNIWLDDSSNPSWPYTTEIMIFEHWGNHVPWEWAEWVGTVNTNGSNYNCWRWWNGGNPESHDGWSFILLRENQRDTGTVTIKNILKWLRNNGDMPNDYIVSIGWGLDAFSRSDDGSDTSTKGKWTASSLSLPNL